MSAVKTLQRMNDRVTKLISEFDNCIAAFESAQLFTGPSLYFHFKTLAIRKKYLTAVGTLSDDDFFDSLYATLAAWGMHRMGAGKAKLTELDEIKDSFRRQIDPIGRIESLSMTGLNQSQVQQVAQQLWDIIAALKVGVGETKIVANSKALHHLLPSLVPPIDREYTTRFFYHHKTFNQGDEAAFLEMYPQFHKIATSRQQEIDQQIGKGMNTSETKVIDNAIVGFVRTYLPKKKQNVQSEGTD
jgi:hypothetical protein